MSKPRCQLTTKDFSILQELLEKDTRHDDAFLRLLRQKLSSATVVFQEDIDPQVATINSRVEFTVDGVADRRTLVYGGVNVFSERTLPVTTLRGLALLGLPSGESVTVERSDGREEFIRLDWVSSQPEAVIRKRMQFAMMPGATEEAPSSVVAFSPRSKPSAARMAATPPGPDDDDPGPRAA